jgi:hypothetical protein
MVSKNDLEIIKSLPLVVTLQQTATLINFLQSKSQLQNYSTYLKCKELFKEHLYYCQLAFSLTET